MICRMAGEDLEVKEDRYDLLEHQIRDLIASGASPSRLVREMEALREAAANWVSSSYGHFNQLRDQLGPSDRTVIEAEIAAEVAEAISELWMDLQSAWAGEQPPVRSRTRQSCVHIAGEIGTGATEPYGGAKRIWALLAEEGRTYPSDLAVFVGLASEWEDHPSHRPQYEEDIVAAAKAFAEASR